jgi:flagellar basal body-associated protein FliL
MKTPNEKRKLAIENMIILMLTILCIAIVLLAFKNYAKPNEHEQPKFKIETVNGLVYPSKK